MLEERDAISSATGTDRLKADNGFLASESPSQAAFDYIARVARAYAALVEQPNVDANNGLGGKLFYVGELDDEARALIVAANIAGAATIAATADRDLQKQALREGVVDFAVTTLDEALRILKNQLRKRETVAVCVALPPAEMEHEMNERGVAPDLVRSEILFAPHHVSLFRGDEEDPHSKLSKIPAIVTWQAGSSLPKDLAVLDEIALSCLDPDEWRSRRWLRLAPRYLGRMAQGLRLIESHREFSARLWEELRKRTGRGEIHFSLEVRTYRRGAPDRFRYDPNEAPANKPS